MAEKILKAPGFYTNEVEVAPVTQESVGVPYAVIGATEKGPAFVPTTLGSFPDFEAKFGTLNPKYMTPYAADKTLQYKTALTVMKVLGAGANSTTTHFSNTETKGTVTSAGMQVSGSTTNIASLSVYDGAVQFLCARHSVATNEAYGYPIFTDNDSYSIGGSYAHMVRGVIFPASGTRIMVFNGTGESFSNTLNDMASLDSTSTNPTYKMFKIAISSSDATWSTADGFTGVRILTASLDPTNANYVGKILNTNPERFETDKHVLYLDLPVDAEVAEASTAANSVAIFSGSGNTSSVSGDTSLYFREAFGRYNTRYTTPSTPYFISQPYGKTEYDLFYAEALSDGAYANAKYKISIANLKASTDPKNDYGTFALLVRNFSDTDYEPEILEQYNNLTLDPESDNYIAKIIGDVKYTFNFDVENENDRRLVKSGKYPNKSKYIRVVMNDMVERKKVPGTALPFGFHGYHFIKTCDSLRDDTQTYASRLGGVGVTQPRLSGSIVPPLPLRFKITRGDVDTAGSFTGTPSASASLDSRLYWGIKFERTTNVLNANISYEQNALIESLTKFQGIEKLDVLVTGSGMDTFNNNKFTLARVALSNLELTDITSSAETHIKEAAYIRNGVPDAFSYKITDGAWGNRITLASLLNNDTGTNFNKFSEYTKFTAVLNGGWDGINIFDSNAYKFDDLTTSQETGGAAHGSYVSPGANTNWSGVGLANNAVASFRTAIKICTDPLIMSNNVLAIPGIREPLVVDYAMDQIQNTYEYGFLVADIPYYDYSGTRIFDGQAGSYIGVEKTADSFDARALDYNAAAVYFPNITIDDEVNNKKVMVPATVGALAALAYNDKVAYPWWAPAGFNRASLDFVTRTQTRINTPDRNRFDDVRINPIVKFPGEGYVIAAQKTLQQASSALESINVKRMVLEVKRIVAGVAQKLLWDQLTPGLRTKFVNDATIPLSTIQLRDGVASFRIICDDTNNTTADLNAYRMNARIIIVPIRAIEYIVLDFIVTPSGVSFE